MASVSLVTESGKRTETREIRRQQLIEATIESIAQLGLPDTTLATVTQRAGLSHGTVNFHFNNKETLFAETMGYLTSEHFDLWTEALERAGDDPAAGLSAIIAVDFDPQICAPEKLAVWFSFWGQVKYRPAYLDAHDHYDHQRTAVLERLCDEIIAEGGYAPLTARSAVRRIESLIDGLWLNMLLYPEDNRLEEVRADAFSCLADLFPKHTFRVAVATKGS